MREGRDAEGHRYFEVRGKVYGEKGMEGYGPRNVFILRVARIFANRVEKVVKFRFLRN